MMHIQSGDFKTGYESTAQLLSCLNERESDESFLGTDDPMNYIDIDWNDLFALHYSALFQYHADSDNAVKTAFRQWLKFGARCEEGFLSNVKDISAAKRYILEEIENSKYWAIQCECFKLLARLHERLNELFDKSAQALELINCEDDFRQYFQGIIQQNSRRPALRDEMSIVYGKSEVTIKKRK